MEEVDAPLTRGLALQIARVMRRMTILTVSSATGVPVSTISRIENDFQCEWRSIATLALFYNSDLNYLAKLDADSKEDEAK